MKRILVTGSNRGIGLEFTRQYLEAGWRVYATCRRPAEAQALHTLTSLHSNLSIHRLDITLQEDICNLCQELGEIPLDILINNAGVYFRNPGEGEMCIHYDNWRRTLEVNTLGTVRVTEALLENIEKNKKPGLVVVISSHTDTSAASDALGSMYYRSSKAALNVSMKGLAAVLRQKNVGVLLLNPGRVITRMGPEKGIPKRESVDGMRQIITTFTMEKSGTLFHYNGQELAW